MEKYPITQSEYNWRRFIGENIITDAYRINHEGALPSAELVTLFVEEELNAVFTIVPEEEKPCRFPISKH